MPAIKEYRESSRRAREACSARVGLKWRHDLEASAGFSKGLAFLKGEGWAGKSPCGSPRDTPFGSPSRKKVLGRRKARTCRVLGCITVPTLLCRSSLAEWRSQGLAISAPCGTSLTGGLCSGAPVGFVGGPYRTYITM